MRRPDWCVEVYLGHLRSGKSSLAYQRLLDYGGGVFITNRGVPQHFTKRPVRITDCPEDMKHLGYYLRGYSHLQIVLRDGHLPEVLSALRGREHLNVVIDDVWVLANQVVTRQFDCMSSLDAFLQEAGQFHVCAILTTHRSKKQLSPFVQENASAIWWVGPCAKEDTRKEIFGLYSGDMDKKTFFEMIRANPMRRGFRVRGSD